MARYLLKLVIVAFMLPGVADAWAQGEYSEDRSFAGQKNAPVYQRDSFNYPHPLPPDYVYRTDRVFSPPTGNGLGAFFDGSDKKQAPPPGAAGQPAGGGRLAQQIHLLSRQLLGNAKEQIADNYAVMVSTFVNLNRLYSTSSLGRYISEQLISELQFAGIDVIEVRQSPGIMISQGSGEYSLSRDMDELSFVQPVQATVVGTYTVAGGEVFINARVLRNTDRMVLSAANLVVGVDHVIQRLLADETMPPMPGKPVQVRAFNE